MTAEMSIQRDRFPSLNGLRAVSILLVILHHLHKKAHVFDRWPQSKWLLPVVQFLQDGHLGVNIFFVISGFLICSLMLKEELQTNTISLKKFYIRRVLRIFPAYYFLLLVYFILNAIDWAHISNTDILKAFAYTKDINNGKVDWLTGHAWSLSLEEHFYLLWPLIFIGGDQCRKWGAWMIVLFVPVIRLFVYYRPVSWISDMTIFTRIDAIATGCLFAFYKDRIIKIISSNWSRFFYISVTALFFLRYFQIIANKVHAGFIFIPLGLTHGTVANFLIGIIMLYSVCGPKTVWFKFLNLKLVNYIGLLSYSIYLWQQLFISDLTWWAAKFPQNLGFIAAMALFSYYIIEKPFLRLKEKFSGAKTGNPHSTKAVVPLDTKPQVESLGVAVEK